MKRLALLPTALLPTVMAPTVMAMTVMAMTSSAQAADYYVTPTGGDAASGAMDAPWQTLQHAADQVQAGDTVHVAAGNYAGFYLEATGSQNAPIVFVADSGATVDQDNGTTPDGINVENSAWVTVVGFTVVAATRAGIRCALSDNVTFRANTSRDNGSWGILTGFCNDVLIERNDCSGSIDEHGVYVSNSADRPVVRANVLWGNNANGLHMNGDVSLGGDGMIEDAIVEGNVIYDNGLGGGSGINCDGCLRALIQNNLVYDTHASGISLYRIDAAGGSQDNIIVNNTVVVADDGRWALNIQDGSTNNAAINNILLNRHSARGSIDISSDSLGGFVSSNNMVMDRFTVDGNSTLSLSEWQAMGHGNASLVGDESVFVDAALDDYHPLADSAPVDAGSSDNAPTIDLDGTMRPFGAAIDIGAFEYCEGDACGPGGPNGGAGGGGTGGSGASAGSGGAGAGSAANAAPADTDDGCGCSTPGRASGHGWTLLAALALPLRRRYRSQRGRITLRA